MGSSDIVTSGRVRSGFSSTCNRLSRYLKEKGSNLGDIGLAFTPQRNFETKGTMNLLSMIDDKSRHHNEKSDKSHEAAQMTIFYGGRILVFDDLPADKAREILTFAGELSSRADNSLRPPLDSDLPIARKKSLSRFLEKRKERAASNAPYPPLVKAEEGSWLGLAPELSLRI